jgi:hypothetical protein
VREREREKAERDRERELAQRERAREQRDRVPRRFVYYESMKRKLI